MSVDVAGLFCFAGRLTLRLADVCAIFNTTTERITKLIDDQLAQTEGGVGCLFLVGGYAASPYLTNVIRKRYTDKIPLIRKPASPGNAVLEGERVCSAGTPPPPTSEPRVPESELQVLYCMAWRLRLWFRAARAALTASERHGHGRRFSTAAAVSSSTRLRHRQESFSH
jgi:hypothetical protein